MVAGLGNMNVARRRWSILNVVLCLAIGGTGVAVFGQQEAKKRSTLEKPALKKDRVAPARRPVLQSRDMPSEKMVNVFSGTGGAKSLDIPLTIDTYVSWDAKGDASNIVLTLDVAAMAGLGTGNPATMTGAGWNVTIDTTDISTTGVSWLEEATIEFDENIAPGTNWIALSPGAGDQFAGVATYDSGGIVDFTDAGVTDIYLPDGMLRIEFFEDYDDGDDVIDALYTTGSAITIVLLDTNSGACCNDATAACVTTDPASCVGAGETYYVSEDCATFTCPPPPADYVMDGTPVTTCSGTFADSGDTAYDYGPSEYIVQTFTPDTVGMALEFDFTFFDVETSWDSLTIYNGNSTAAPLIGVFDTGTPPGTITSGAADGSLTFEFESDSSVSKPGWIAEISCVTPPEGGACCDPLGGCTDVADEALCVAPNTYAGNGTNCASYTCPAPGDDCGNPLVVDFSTDLPFEDLGQTNCGRGNAYSDTCLGLYDSGEDIVYELVVPADMCVDVVMTSDTNYTGMAVDGICPLGDPCLASSTSGYDQDLLALSLTAGTHYLMLDTWASPDCINSFDLSITECSAGGACCHDGGTCTDEVGGAASCGAAGDVYIGDGTSCATSICPAPNDLCDNATKISVVPFDDLGVDMAGSTDDANVDPSCDSSYSCGTGPANNGVWYTFTPGESCEATIDQAGIDAATSVWTGADCVSLTQVVCSDPDPVAVPMAAGVEYFILISNWSCSSEPSSAIDFTFDCVPLPKGACCEQGAGVCSCTEVAEVDCAGTYRGDGSSCFDSPDPCDCNANGTCDPGDLLPGVAQDFDATGFPVAIPDNDPVGVTHVLTVPSLAIADLNVGLAITHTWRGDLTVELESPLGTIVRLHDGSGGSADDIAQTYDDEGNPPEGPGLLSDFDSEDAVGDWLLHVTDGAGGDTGTIEGWSLHFNALPPTSDDCNSNGVPDECEADCDGNGIPDDCDVAGGATDCNLNGAPDACDVPPIGMGADCQDDGIPDECQLGSVPGGGSVVADGGFEAGTPNPSWAEASTAFGTPLCDYASCGLGGGTGPHGGDWWSWFGGVDAAVEVGSVEQTVTIPSGATTMEFYYENPVSSGNGTDSVSALIDGTVLWTGMEGNAAYATYALVTVDISAYGDGGSHVLRFESSTDNPVGVLSNFFIDDVEIVAPTGAPENDCNENGVPDECDTPVCGNDCLEGTQECDGTEDAACPGLCYAAGSAYECMCPFCGDDAVGGVEDCDGGVCCTAGCGFDTGTECRASTGVCDPAETCGGSSADCPDDFVITECVQSDGCCPDGCNATNDDDCAAVCGNGITEAAEVCDGADDAACPGACMEGCVCPTCGDDIVNQASEVCDGADDSACPGLCLPGCMCPTGGGIPTTSAWGLATLALLLLAGAKIYFGRRSRSVAR